jgi:hypothetical protein
MTLEKIDILFVKRLPDCSRASVRRLRTAHRAVATETEMRLMRWLLEVEV